MSRRRPYNWRWQLQPPVVTKAPPASDVIVPAMHPPTINGPARPPEGGQTETPVDGTWPAGVPHPSGPSFKARPLKIWRKRLARRAGGSGKAAGRGIGMPMDLPGGLSSVKAGDACRNAGRCLYEDKETKTLLESGALPSPARDYFELLTTRAAATGDAAQELCSITANCTAVLWDSVLESARLYHTHGDAVHGKRAYNPNMGKSQPERAHGGVLYQKEGCPLGLKCGGAVLKDDVKSRSQGIPIRKPQPGDNFYDPAAQKTVCVACTPENNRIRSTVSPVLGPGPNRTVDRMATATRADRRSEVTTAVLYRDMFIPLASRPVRTMTIEEAIKELETSDSKQAFTVPSGNEDRMTPTEVIFFPEAPQSSFEYNPGVNTYVKEPSFFTYVPASINYASYLHSRCKSVAQRQLHGSRVRGLPYFSAAGQPLPPSSSRAAGPPNYVPAQCQTLSGTLRACSIPYKTRNSRFAVQGATTSGSRLARLKYEGLTRGTNFTTAGALRANNFGEFSAAPPSGYFIPQRHRVNKPDAGLYRRSGKRVACFRPEPRPIDRIEH